MRPERLAVGASAAPGGEGSEVAAHFRGRLGAFVLDVAFAAPPRGVTALFGPSGSGKTSVLRAVAGLQRLDGHLRVGGETWQDGRFFLPPHRRAVGYVFQEASLFPHLSVEANMLYGARRTGGIEAARIEEIVALLALAPLLGRAPDRLSGGERQRVALARALLSRPKILLMDEPLSALDAQAKDEILPFLERLHAGLAIPVLYVSHDIAEVERLADRVVVLRQGRVAAHGPLDAALADSGLSRRSGAASVLSARVVGFDAADGLAELDLFGQPLVVVGGSPSDVGLHRRVRVEASDVSLSREPPVASTILNTLRVEIVRVEAGEDPAASVTLRVGDAAAGALFLARITRRSLARFDFQPGERVFAQVKAVSLATAGASSLRSPPGENA